MQELRELYQELILDHGKNPRHAGTLDKYTNKANGYNHLCGDKIDLYLILDKDTIKDIKFNASGCAISVASASLMAEHLIGKKIQEAIEMFNNIKAVLICEEHSLTQTNVESSIPEKLKVLCGVKEFPSRIKCATLPWHTLKASFKQDSDNDIFDIKS